MTAKPKSIYSIETSKHTTRKYPNVIWFPRSKTDPREIREVLKLALKTQGENPEGFFNDKMLGEKMALIGSINVVGYGGAKYIDSYKGKNTADVSYITNARMLIRLFRFLGFVTRLGKGRYVLTDLGIRYCSFVGDFPNHSNGTSEEQMLLDSLANFGFYCVNDDSSFRDAKFRIRPFVWLLNCMSIEPQCIFQLIVTTFASQAEDGREIKRIKSILHNLRSGDTSLKAEWGKLGLDADDYSCVHNFYDSAKILVYLGASLGLIEKISDPQYGKRISGKARHLKQATTFYALTKKGLHFLKNNLSNRLVYYDEIYNIFGDKSVLDVSILFASLNYAIGNIKVTKINKRFFSKIANLGALLIKIKSKFGIDIDMSGEYLTLKTPISFSFYQSIPPEILHNEIIQGYYKRFMAQLNKDQDVKIAKDEYRPSKVSSELSPYFELGKDRRYIVKDKTIKELEEGLKYSGKDEIYGGSDRFSSRVSPTNSVIIKDGMFYVDNKVDALDLLVPLRIKDKELVSFIEKNINDLINNFIAKSDTWEKDQHYIWVRNCFRHLGMEAIYSGSSGMLSRADVSITKPFIGGIEVKSPRENRGTINLKAIRQAIDAKIQVADQCKGKDKLPRVGIAIGRRISDLAIREEKKWANENQPALLLNDIVLYYIVIKSAVIPLSLKSLVDFFTSNHGLVNRSMVLELFRRNTKNKKDIENINREFDSLSRHLGAEAGADGA